MLGTVAPGNMPSALALRGDRVEIGWGLDTVEATIEVIYESGIGTRVLVRVPILGPSGEELEQTTVTLPVEAIHGVLA